MEQSNSLYLQYLSNFEKELETQKTESISKCKTLGELYQALEQFDSLTSYSRGYPKTYTVEILISLIESVIDNAYPSTVITRANGLRQKVQEIIYY